VVAVCILDALEDVSIDFPNKGGLLIRKNVFDSLNGKEARHQIGANTSPGGRIYLLDHTTSIHLKGELKDMPIHGIRQSGLLNLRSVLEQFLDHVVSKNVLNELEGVVGNDLVEDDLLLIAGGGLELLLDETRAVLVPTKLDDVSKDIPQLPLAGLVGAEILQQRTPKRSRVFPPPCAHTLREPMGTVQSIHPGDEKTDRGIVVQRITLGMRRGGRSHRGRIHHRLELSLLVDNAGRERRAQHWRMASVNDGLRGVIELRRRGSGRSAVIVEHGGLWAMEFRRVHRLWPYAWVHRL